MSGHLSTLYPSFAAPPVYYRSYNSFFFSAYAGALSADEVGGDVGPPESRDSNHSLPLSRGVRKMDVTLEFSTRARQYVEETAPGETGRRLGSVGDCHIIVGTDLLRTTEESRAAGLLSWL